MKCLLCLPERDIDFLWSYDRWYCPVCPFWYKPRKRFGATKSYLRHVEGALEARKLLLANKSNTEPPRKGRQVRTVAPRNRPGGRKVSR